MKNQASRKPNGAYRAPLRGEAERLLKLAEDLQSKCEETREAMRQDERRSLLRFLAIATIAGLVMAYYSAPTIQDSIALTFVVLFVIPLVLSALGSWIKRTLGMTELKSRLRHDEHALFEVVALLHEKQATLAESEGWSTLQQAELRVRLSRFDIGCAGGRGTPRPQPR